MPPQHVHSLGWELFRPQILEGFDAPKTRERGPRNLLLAFWIKSLPPFIKFVSRNLETMERLSIWLLFVGFCRLSAVYFGFFDVWALRLAVYSRLITMQDVHGRTFGVWTLLTCTLCVFCAFNLDNKPLYQITFLSFVFALGYFILECFVYHTMAVKNLLSLFFFAGGSIIWMSLEWNKHLSPGLKKQV